MRPYRFPLEAVLKLRKMKEEKALDEYAASVNKCLEKRTALLAAVNREENLMQMVLEGRRGAFSPKMQSAYNAALDDARKSIRTAEKAVNESERQKEKKLTLFLELKQEAEVLVRLRKQQKVAFEKEQLRKEELELEDLIMSRRAFKGLQSETIQAV